MRNTNIQMSFTRTSDIKPNEVITLKTIPQSISYSYSPKFISQNVLGRATPIYQYSGAGGQSMSFSIDLHEDVHTEEGETLDDVIKKIKRLSTPEVDAGGFLIEEYPRVLFELGELYYFVKVETVVEWKKPMRNGKYILATVSFTLDVLEELKEIIHRDYLEKVGERIDGDYYYGDTMGYVLTQKQLDSEAHTVVKSLYNVNLDNLLIDSYNLIGNKTQIAAWDAEVQRLINLFGVYQRTDSSTFDSKRQGKIKGIAEDTYELPTTRDDYKELEKRLNRIKADHNKIVEDYYQKNIDNMLTSERDAVKKYIEGIIDTLLDIANGVVGYGPAS